MQRARIIVAVAAAVGAVLAGPVLGGPLDRAGDGAQTNNPDLLRPALDGMDGACSDCDPGPSIVGLDDPFFEVDWSVALRGSYVQDSASGDYFEGSVAPTLSLTHTGPSSSLSVTGSAELVRSTIEQTRLAALQLAVAADYLFNVSTLLSADARFILSRAAANAPGNAANVVMGPQVIEGSANLALQETFGAFEVTARGSAGRALYGETTLTGGVLQDNSWQNNVSAGGGLRVGLALSPILTAFADVSASYARYDAPSPTLLVPFDGPTYAARAGLSARWNGVLSTEASVGLGLRQYDAAGLSAFQGVLYDGRVTFTPDESWVFNASLATSLLPPGSSGGGGRIAYGVAGDARYQVNPWLALRASAGWNRTEVIGTGAVETGYSLGVGTDYAVNDNATVTADYTFAQQDTPARSTHRFMLGLVFAK